jgi:tryptophan synthase alpha chain
MGRLSQLFDRKKERILNVYCTAGYPAPDGTLEMMHAIQEAGADIIELGMPYSDPLADGPVIQNSSQAAIANGMTIEKLFLQLQDMRPRLHIPVILMGYLNPVMQYGFERFCRDASAAGVDGLILPDLPEFEFESAYGPVIRNHGLDFVFLVTPETSEERVRRLDALSSGFLYAVSSSSITGAGKDMSTAADYLERLKGYGLSNPVLVGFGIHDKAGFDAACMHANGAIIGSAFIKAVGNAGDPVGAAMGFIKGIIG